MKKIIALFALFICTASFAINEKNVFTIPQDSSMVYDFPEKMAQFPGGADAMDMFIRKNLEYPAALKESGVVGKVYVQFIVEKDGTITDVKVRRGTNTGLDNEAVKVIEKMPNWLPGSVRGKKVRVKQTIPITFSLS